jgi:hypothetical protein
MTKSLVCRFVQEARVSGSMRANEIAVHGNDAEFAPDSPSFSAWHRRQTFVF